VNGDVRRRLHRRPCTLTIRGRSLFLIREFQRRSRVESRVEVEVGARPVAAWSARWSSGHVESARQGAKRQEFDDDLGAVTRRPRGDLGSRGMELGVEVAAQSPVGPRCAAGARRGRSAPSESAATSIRPVPSKDRCLERGPRQTPRVACDLRWNDIRHDEVRRTCAQLTILMLEPTLRSEIFRSGIGDRDRRHRGSTEAGPDSRVLVLRGCPTPADRDAPRPGRDPRGSGRASCASRLPWQPPLGPAKTGAANSVRAQRPRRRRVAERLGL
jgi:hypothetical protein